MVHIKDETYFSTQEQICFSLFSEKEEEEREKRKKRGRRRRKQIKRHFDRITAYQSVGSVLLKADVKWARAYPFAARFLVCVLRMK